MLHEPDRLLLRALLQQTGTAMTDAAGVEQLHAVLAAYTGVYLLGQGKAPPMEAEAALLGTLTELGQEHTSIATLSAVLSDMTAAAKASTFAAKCHEWRSENSSLAAEALVYFTSESTLRAAAAGQLLLQVLEGGGSALSSVLTPMATGTTELEVACLALLMPGWESLIARLSTCCCGGQLSSSAGMAAEQYSATALWGAAEPSSCPAWHPATTMPQGTASPTLHSELVTMLCTVWTDHPGALLALPPPLLAEACRFSFRFAAAYVSVLAAQGVSCCTGGDGWSGPLAAHAAHATLHADHISDYVWAKLEACDGTGGCSTVNEV